MNTNSKYRIPTGTRIKTRNVFRQLKMKPHITRQELSFGSIANTGDGGLLWYFQHGDWLISVEARQVLTDASLAQTAAA